MQIRKLLILTPVCAALVIVANTPSEVTRHRASLSDDLQAFQASHSTSAVRVIALGREDDLRAVANRHGVHIVRLLENAAVLEATAAQIDTLRNEPGIESESGRENDSDETNTGHVSEHGVPPRPTSEDGSTERSQTYTPFMSQESMRTRPVTTKHLPR